MHDKDHAGLDTEKMPEELYLKRKRLPCMMTKASSHEWSTWEIHSVISSSIAGSTLICRRISTYRKFKVLRFSTLGRFDVDDFHPLQKSVYDFTPLVLSMISTY